MLIDTVQESILVEVLKSLEFKDRKGQFRILRSQQFPLDVVLGVF